MPDLNPQSAAILGPLIRAKITANEPVWLTVTGRSMTPTFRHGRDAVMLEPISDWPPRRGEVLFIQRRDGSYVLHRVIRIVGSHIILNGDGQLWMEGPISRDMAIARVAMYRRRGRFRSVGHPLYRLYCGVWMRLRPLRRRLFALYRALKRGAGK